MSLKFRAEEAGITVMNEVGVDPGIDHMLAIQCFENVEEHGGKVTLESIFCRRSKLDRNVIAIVNKFKSLVRFGRRPLQRPGHVNVEINTSEVSPFSLGL